MSLVLDLRITHELFGSSSDRCITGHLHYPNDLDTLNESSTDKIHQYLVDYNNRPSNTISFSPGMTSTSGRLHSEFVCLLVLQVLYYILGVSLVYYESIKRDLEIKPIHECRCDERLQTKTKRFTRLAYTLRGRRPRSCPTSAPK